MNQDQVVEGNNGGEVLNPEVGVAAEGEIIVGEAFIELNDIVPNVIEEVFDPNIALPDQPVPDLPVANLEAVQALQAPPMNWLVEEILEDMLMVDAELALEANDVAEENQHPVQQQPQDDLQLGMVEIFDSHTVDPGLAHLSSQAPVTQNVEAVRLWAQHFKGFSSSRPTVNIPLEWCNFLTSLLLSPTHFN